MPQEPSPHTTTPTLDKIPGPMDARFVSSVGFGFGTRKGRTQLFPTPWEGLTFPRSLNQVRKNSLNIKFLGGIFLGHPWPRRRDVPDKNFMQVTFFCRFRQGVAGMSRDLGRDVPDLEKLYARKLWADFLYPIKGEKFEIEN